MKNFYSFLMLVLLSFAVGCETPNENSGAPNNDQGDMGPSVVRVTSDVEFLELRGDGLPFTLDEYFCLQTNASFGGEETYMQELSEKLTKELREHISRWRTIYCINQSTKEFHIYADKVLWGVAAGEPLEEYFQYCNNFYDFPVTYPKGEINFTKDYFVNRLCDIKDILREDYMIPIVLNFAFKQLPPEKYDEVTFTIYLRTSDGKEYTTSANFLFE